MNAFDQLVALRPCDEKLDPAQQAALRTTLFGSDSPVGSDWLLSSDRPESSVAPLVDCDRRRQDQRCADRAPW